MTDTLTDEELQALDDIDSEALKGTILNLLARVKTLEETANALLNRLRYLEARR